MKSDMIKSVFELSCVVLIVVGFSIGTVRAETTFLANFNNPQAKAGSEALSPDYVLGGMTPRIAVISTPANNINGMASSTSPVLDNNNAVASGPSSLKLTGDQDSVSYLYLPKGTVPVAQGTAEGFFKTSYSLASDVGGRVFLSAEVVGENGAKWQLQIATTTEQPNKLMVTMMVPGQPKFTYLSGAFADPKDWETKVWHHLALTWRSDSVTTSSQLFVDGRLVGTASSDIVSSATFVESAVGGRISVGLRPDAVSTGASLEWQVDSLRFDNTVLYDATGFSISQQVFTPPATELQRAIAPYASSATVWSAVSSAAASNALKVLFDHRTVGQKFSCDMSLVQDGGRCTWFANAAGTLDLSKSTSFSAWIKVKNASAISAVNLYFRSSANGGGYYSWYIAGTDLFDGWNNVAIDLSSIPFEPLGASLSWGQIDQVLVSVWKRAGGSGQATIRAFDVEASLQQSAERPFEYPEYDVDPKPVRLIRSDANNGAPLENRSAWDEGPTYLATSSSSLTSAQKTDAILSKMRSAGYNVYIPIAWHGDGAAYQSLTAPLDPRYAAEFQNTPSGQDDPLDALIKKAHADHIEVHPWYTVALAQPQGGHSMVSPELQRFIEPGTPSQFEQAFEMHQQAFRDFMVNEIVAFVKRYNVDGIVLDYIRTVGLSSSASAEQSYRDFYQNQYTLQSDRTTLLPAAQQRIYAWQAAAVSDIVQRVSAGVRSIKPWINIAVYGHALPKPTMNYEGRNEWLWVENNWVDTVYDGDYSLVPDVSRLAAARESTFYPGRFLRLVGNYDWIGQTVVPRDARLYNKQIEYFLRKFPERGVSTYIFGQMSDAQAQALRQGVLANDALPYFNTHDDFEGKPNGSYLNVDKRWVGYNNSPVYVPTATVTGDIAASGSAKSAAFRNINSMRQIYWLNMPSTTTVASAEFDIYLADRNPNSSGTVNFEIRPSYWCR